MDLRCGSGVYYLTWKDFRFASDSITASFRYHDNQELLENVAAAIPDYKGFMEDYIHRSYTIGGMIIFPKHSGSINQRRGTHPFVRDRRDLTLECIRRFYLGQDSPLYSTLQRDKAFFDLFIDFKGYIDYFFLQDCVTDDYSKVEFLLGDGDFRGSPIPPTVEQYLSWIDSELEFVQKRNRRIEAYAQTLKTDI